MSGVTFMFALFLFMVAIMLFVNWYAKRHKTWLDPGQIILLAFAVIFGSVFFLLKKMAGNERSRIIDNVQLHTTVTNITFDTHKPYFKNMTLADGQYLPMPEAMNYQLKIGDSIYKKKGEHYYTVVSALANSSVKYEVKVHERVLSKPQ